MAAKERIIFQPYTTGRGNNVLPSQAVLCRNPEDAQRRAEKAMAGGRIVGPTSSEFSMMRRQATMANPSTSPNSAECPAINRTPCDLRQRRRTGRS